MATQVTIKMSAIDFDNLRKAVDLARSHSRELWQNAKMSGLDKDQHITPHYQFELTCEKLLENVLN